MTDANCSSSALERDSSALERSSSSRPRSSESAIVLKPRASSPSSSSRWAGTRVVRSPAASRPVASATVRTGRSTERRRYSVKPIETATRSPSPPRPKPIARDERDSALLSRARMTARSRSNRRAKRVRIASSRWRPPSVSIWLLAFAKPSSRARDLDERLRPRSCRSPRSAPASARTRLLLAGIVGHAGRRAASCAAGRPPARGAPGRGTTALLRRDVAVQAVLDRQQRLLELIGDAQRLLGAKRRARRVALAGDGDDQDDRAPAPSTSAAAALSATTLVVI